MGGSEALKSAIVELWRYRVVESTSLERLKSASGRAYKDSPSRRRLVELFRECDLLLLRVV